jgi:ribosomal protein S18 acetylase RimI-like enzyme
MKNVSVTIREATGDQDMATARRLFQDYAAWLGIDLGYQSFDEELATLPGPYAAPSGLILLAERDGLAIGCVALREIADAVGEVKRLYVSPRYQGGGIGKRLMESVIVEAKVRRYARIRLDTLPKMTAAQRLYRSLGFKPIAPYYDSPITGTTYMELSLGAWDNKAPMCSTRSRRVVPEDANAKRRIDNTRGK